MLARQHAVGPPGSSKTSFEPLSARARIPTRRAAAAARPARRCGPTGPPATSIIEHGGPPQLRRRGSPRVVDVQSNSCDQACRAAFCGDSSENAADFLARQRRRRWATSSRTDGLRQRLLDHFANRQAGGQRDLRKALDRQPPMRRGSSTTETQCFGPPRPPACSPRARPAVCRAARIRQGQGSAASPQCASPARSLVEPISECTSSSPTNPAEPRIPLHVGGCELR